MASQNRWFNTVTLTPGQYYTDTTPGKCVTMQVCNQAVLASFDGGPWQVATQGSVADLRDPDDANGGGFNSVTFGNNNLTSVTFTYCIADVPVAYQAGSNAVSNAATYAVGNLNIPNGSAAGSQFSGSPACSSTGFLSITNNMRLAIGNIDPATGKRRQIIVLGVAITGTQPLMVQDANGCVMGVYYSQANVPLVVDAPIYLSGQGGTALVTVAQFYLVNS